MVYLWILSIQYFVITTVFLTTLIWHSLILLIIILILCFMFYLVLLLYQLNFMSVQNFMFFTYCDVSWMIILWFDIQWVIIYILWINRICLDTTMWNDHVPCSCFPHWLMSWQTISQIARNQLFPIKLAYLTGDTKFQSVEVSLGFIFPTRIKVDNHLNP